MKAESSMRRGIAMNRNILIGYSVESVPFEGLRGKSFQI